MSSSTATVRLIVRRGIVAIPILLGIVILNFLLVQLADGDAASVLAGESGGAPPEYLAQLRSQFGLDRPLYVQLWHYVTNILTLDLGYSFRFRAPVLDVILERLGATLLLMGCAFTLSLAIGIVLGVVAANSLNTWKDRVISVIAVVSYATPLFWLGLMLILLFSVQLNFLPTSGMEDVVAFYEGWDRVWDIARHLVLPTVTLALFYSAIYARMMRASMLEQRGMDYVTTARAKGLNNRHITYKHVMRNALLPVVTMAGIQAGAMLGGSVVIESVFAWPGLGQLAFQALFARDFSLLLGIFFLSACLVVVVNLLMDIIYMALDPRISIR